MTLILEVEVTALATAPVTMVLTHPTLPCSTEKEIEEWEEGEVDDSPKRHKQELPPGIAQGLARQACDLSPLMHQLIDLHMNKPPKVHHSGGHA